MTHSQMPLPGRRIAVVGSTGSGKTTLAGLLADELNLKHIELDALHWEADWSAAPMARFRQRVTDALAADDWTIDGNYSKVRQIIWAQADTIVWLDYAFPLIMWRLFRRTMLRIVRRELLWGTNRESIRIHFFSRDSLFWWAIKTYRRRRREYSDLFGRPEYAHLIRIHLTSPRETNAWLTHLRRQLKVNQKDTV